MGDFPTDCVAVVGAAVRFLGSVPVTTVQRMHHEIPAGLHT